MGAIARQVLQVKRKNSTNCSPPEARLTVAGSVASRLGPREVATGKTVASSLGAGWRLGSSVGAARVAVGRAAGSSVTAAGEMVAENSGPHAASKMRISMALGMKCFFIIVLRRGYSTKFLRKDYRTALRLCTHQGGRPGL